MFAKDHEETLGKLIGIYLPGGSMEYTDDLDGWRKDNGLKPDPGAPLALATGDPGARLGVLEVISEKSVDERIKALAVRGALQSTEHGLADLLDSPVKKLAYLFMKELTGTKEEFDDDLVADNWIAEEMRLHGFFRQ